MDFTPVLQSLIAQSPLAAVLLLVAWIFMEKHEKTVGKLISTFEQEVKACEDRFQMVFNELMRIKDQIK